MPDPIDPTTRFTLPAELRPVTRRNRRVYANESGDGASKDDVIARDLTWVARAEAGGPPAGR